MTRVVRQQLRTSELQYIGKFDFEILNLNDQISGRVADEGDKLRLIPDLALRLKFIYPGHGHFRDT